VLNEENLTLKQKAEKSIDDGSSGGRSRMGYVVAYYPSKDVATYLSRSRLRGPAKEIQ